MNVSPKFLHAARQILLLCVLFASLVASSCNRRGKVVNVLFEIGRSESGSVTISATEIVGVGDHKVPIKMQRFLRGQEYPDDEVIVIGSGEAELLRAVLTREKSSRSWLFKIDASQVVQTDVKAGGDLIVKSRNEKLVGEMIEFIYLVEEKVSADSAR